MSGHRIFVVGASAGGVEALAEFAAQLPAHLPAPIFIVVHFPSRAVSVLPDILRRAGRLPAKHAQDGEAIQPGWIYIAPPDQHMILEDGRIKLTYGPREHGFRPAIDTLFRSAAQAYGPQSVGVILTGALSDGAAGILAIKRAGGLAIVQDPNQALFPNLPSTVIESDHVDLILPLTEIVSQVKRLARQPVEKGAAPVPEGDRFEEGPGMQKEETESQVVKSDIQAFENGDLSTPRTIISCPDCGGVLWEVQAGKLVRYECQIGSIQKPVC